MGGSKQKFMRLLNQIIPKKNIILFESFPDFSDNSYALYQYIIKERLDITKKYEIIWAKKGNLQVSSESVDDNTTVINKKSIKGYWSFLRSKYVFSTHGYFAGVQSGHGQVQVNLWHGCGYKGMTEQDTFYRGDYTIATSDLYKKIQSDALNIDIENVLVTGLPRNDRMYKKSDVLKKLNINSNNFDSVLIWLPTYRKAKIGHNEVDGQPDSFGLASINDDQYRILNKLLENKKMLLIIKPHPMESIEPKRLTGCESIQMINNQSLMNVGVDLYDLLPETDALLSDYSSVIVDYLQLNKPIALVLSDMDEYKNSRGFVFKNVKEFMPGPVISSFEGLEKYIKTFHETNEKWQDKRRKINGMLNAYCDGSNSKRVCDCIFGVSEVLK